MGIRLSSGSLHPQSPKCFDRPENGAVRLFAYPGLAGFQMVHREVHMVRIGLSVPGVAIGAFAS